MENKDKKKGFEDRMKDFGFEVVKTKEEDKKKDKKAI